MTKKDISRLLEILKSQWFITAFKIHGNRKLKTFDWYIVYVKDNNWDWFLVWLSKWLIDTSSSYYLRKLILSKMWIFLDD